MEARLQVRAVAAALDGARVDPEAGGERADADDGDQEEESSHGLMVPEQGLSGQVQIVL